MIDEFSKLAARPDAAVDLVERVRSFRVGVLLIGQTWASLGPTDTIRERLAGTVGTVLIHQLKAPERLVALAGTTRTCRAHRADRGARPDRPRQSARHPPVPRQPRLRPHPGDRRSRADQRQASTASAPESDPRHWLSPAGQALGPAPDGTVHRSARRTMVARRPWTRRAPTGPANSCGDLAQRRALDSFRVTAARTRVFNAFSLIRSPSWKSMARRVLPSRLELKRPEGSFSAAPWRRSSSRRSCRSRRCRECRRATTSGTPRHFHSSTASGSASLTTARSPAEHLAPPVAPPSSFRFFTASIS